MNSKNEYADFIQESLELANKASKKGLYNLALARYSQALGMLQMLWLVYDKGDIHITKRGQEMLATLTGWIEAGYQKLIVLMGNGRKNPKVKDSVAQASRYMLKDLRSM